MAHGQLETERAESTINVDDMSAPNKNVLEQRGPNAFSLTTLFLIVTACALFFGCLRLSPILAVVSTLFIAPAIIRTSIICELHRRNGGVFSIKDRILCFVGSLGVVLMTALFGASVFVLICLLFGLFGWVISLMAGASNLSLDAAVLGTAGGMVWGIAGAILATTAMIVRTWIPKQILRFPNPEYTAHLQ